MSTKLTRIATVIAVAFGLAWGTATSAQAGSPVLYRFHAVHNAFSGANEICGIAADWTYTENATILVKTAKDITLPDLWAYGKVLGPVTETFTTAHGSITQERRLSLMDAQRSYSEADGVVNWQARFSGTIRLVDNSTGRMLTSGAGQVVFHEVWDTKSGILDETVASTSGTLGAYFDSSCAVIAKVLE